MYMLSRDVCAAHDRYKHSFELLKAVKDSTDKLPSAFTAKENTFTQLLQRSSYTSHPVIGLFSSHYFGSSICIFFLNGRSITLFDPTRRSMEAVHRKHNIPVPPQPSQSNHTHNTAVTTAAINAVNAVHT